MLNAQEVADAALAAARDAIDRLIPILQQHHDENSDAEIAVIDEQQRPGLDHHDRRTWESHAALPLLIGARTVVFPHESTLSATSATDATSRKQLWKVELVIEPDDDADVDRISNHVVRAACPACADGVADHECTVPWFVATSPLNDDEAAEWREELNRERRGS